MSKGEPKAQDNRALYRKYRSKSLDEVVGQRHVTDILSRSLQQGKIAHAYLLTGPRGVGKTSIARILAHEINKLPYDDNSTHLDIIEIDAASNNGVDDVRDLREKVQIAPISAAKKVYIIDEVHMLSKPAFNALLKTLEEPPEHVVFILATTDIHKVPDTILSRTQRFTFRSINPSDAQQHLRMIADKEDIGIDDDALILIAEHGRGSFRDSISMLDQLRSLSDGKSLISASLVEQMIGLAPTNEIASLLAAYESQDNQTIIETLDSLDRQGIDARQIVDQIISVIRPRLATHPRWVTLLDALVPVLKSPRPDILLLTSLLSVSSEPATAKKSVATVVTPVAPELEVLANEAIKPRPNEKRVEKHIKEKTIESSVDKPVTEPPSAKKKKTPANAFDWDTYLSYMKEHHIALYSILAKCKTERDGDRLNIYTNTTFWKKKLDDAKYQPLLHKALEELNVEELTIETIPTGAPLKDSQAAAVAAIMGGGEEVELSDA